MKLYHATFADLPLGKPVTPMVVTPVYPNAVAALEAGKPSGSPSRTLCVFATDNLAGATEFAQRQHRNRKGVRVYSVEMDVRHKAPMRIVHTLESCVKNGQPFDRLVNEYWNPSLPWSFYEFFGPSFLPTAEVPPATFDAITIFVSNYLADGDRVQSLC